MSEQTPESGAVPTPLPDSPDLDWLRKNAKRRLTELRKSRPDAKLAEAQRDLAREYGFTSWRALKAHIDSLTIDGQLFDAARKGDADRVASLLDSHPDRLISGEAPYGWTLLHIAAHAGHLALVDLLLRRGLDVNSREKGDNTYAMHWAAAAGHLDVVKLLADSGGDVVGHGDDHELEVIGWATCWDRCDDDAHHAIADFLVSRGAHHHIFTAIALTLGREVRRVIAADPAALSQRMSRNEDLQRPLHFAVRMNRPQMVTLLIELGADPLATDGTGYPPAAYATAPGVDQAVMVAISTADSMDLVTAVSLGNWDAASQLVREHSGRIEPGVLHLAAKRGNADAVSWLIANGADPNALWSHWEARVTPLHLAALAGHTEVARLLVDSGADATIRDSIHDSDPMGWAVFFQRTEIVSLLREREAKSTGRNE